MGGTTRERRPGFRPWWRRVRGWVLLCCCALVGALVGLVAKNWYAGSGAAVVTAVAGMLTTRAKAEVDARAKRVRELGSRIEVSTERGGLRKVRDLPDAVAFHVHPAGVLERPDGRSDRVPPYVRRDVDVRLEKILGSVSFVILVGESTAGKTRTAYEAIRRRLPDHVFVPPTGRADLEHVLATVLEQRKCVVWLDELDRFLGPDGLSSTKVNRILGDGTRQVVVVATMRTTAYARYSPREEAKTDGAGRELLRSGRDVLRLAHRLDLPRHWTEAELARARELAADPRLRKAIEQAAEFGVGEVLAAGPQLLADWHDGWTPGRHPRGAAIVAAAVDCQRAGLLGAVAERTLRRLHEHYLEARAGGSGLQPESFEDGLAWAVEPVPETTSSLLIATGDGYRAFDYLVDTVADPVPAPTWRTLLAKASPELSYDIGLTAHQQGHYDHAEAGLAKAAAGGVPEAPDALARCIADAGRPAEAAALFARMAEQRSAEFGPADPRTLATRRDHAVYLGLAGRLTDAASLLAALAEDCTQRLGRAHVETLTTRYERAAHLSLAGDPRGAARLLAGLLPECVTALGTDHATTLKVRYRHADALGAAGQYVKATALLGALIDDRTAMFDLGDDPETLLARHQQAGYLGRAGQHAAAAVRFEKVVADRARILGRVHPDTMVSRHQHATYLGLSGDYDTAADLFAELAADYLATAGAADTETLFTRYQHAASLAAAGRRSDAVRCLGKALADASREPGADPEVTRFLRDALARWSPAATRP
ncbi:hypothetical protein ACIA5G_14845 [Amycolatopsis sp. NPDC051758]|uniref:hypothetical protein n=1 Tax=Amycolatopsis sp. NPDC051758 TaxID=3363935 RepID=UPI0037B33BA8